MSLLRTAEEAALKDGGYRRKGKRARYRSDVLKLSSVFFFLFSLGILQPGMEKVDWTK